MGSVDHKDELQSAHLELARLLRERERIEVEIARQRRKVAAWAELCGGGLTDANDPGLGGLSDACRTALRASRKEWMTASEIQTALKELGFPLEKYKAPAASITTTVNRLAESGEVVADRRTTPGAIEYRWVGNFESVRKESGKTAADALQKFAGLHELRKKKRQYI